MTFAFLPDLAVVATFTAAAAVLTITPGPDMTLFMSKTLTQGRKAGAAAVFGAASGIVVHSLFAALGISALLATSATAFAVLKYAGAAYLVFLAVQAVRNGSALSLEQAATQKEKLSRVWLQGLTINLLNPKIVLFFVTFLPQFVSASDPFAAQKLLFLGFYFIVLAVPSCLLMVFFASAFARFLKNSPRAMRAFDWTFAGIMGGFALKLLAAQAATR
ncbi:threonine/homoserine/homoserine lactone efflux protein [Roseibium hamelinense]|uniref:Threonine/homoserine/homoserine lactone efflux protein n=1 Tax=Roseibium hamelinense TaxID=150831 RepID=A0A562THB3_9HYPH|nr:LysE family translocator [Roseibium hamelinense]MTI46064.1 LysE family translocator [Roseibium hamelinense]TWI92743.1 threonine/homoserine/homoserine lactone efflux protein [Roseibium hamelinense]